MKRVAGGGVRHVIGKTAELQGLTKTGVVFPIELSLSSWKDSSGLVFTGFIRDITERKQVVAPKVLDLNETVPGILKMLQRLIGEDISLQWHPEANLWPVKVDPSQIDQILANLCINARDAISGVGNIAIETGNSTLDEDYRADTPPMSSFTKACWIKVCSSSRSRFP